MSLLSVFQRHQALKSTNNRVVGIDIGSSSIKVVELQERNGVVTLATYGQLQLGPYEEGKKIGEVVQVSPSIERQALVDVVRESAVKAKQAVLAIPLSTSFVTVMSLEAKADEDLSNRVRVEARKYIPVPITDVALDWTEIEAGHALEGKRDIFLAAIQNDALKRFSSLVQATDFGKSPTEIECFSTIRSSYDAKREYTAIVDIGATITKLYIVHKGLLQRMHRIPTGGCKLTEKIAAELKLSFEEAEDLKCSVTPLSPHFSTIQKLAVAQYGRVFKEMKLVVREHEQVMSVAIEYVTVTGGGAVAPGLIAQLAQEFGRPVALAVPFDKVAYPSFMEDTLHELGPVFSTALGAALRSFES